MKQTILILLSSILLFSCTDKTSSEGTAEYTYNPFSTDIVTINGCQYIVARTNYLGGGLSIIHAANCTNPIHRDATDFPEEWQALGTNKKFPDTLCAYKDSVTGVAHIAFLNK